MLRKPAVAGQFYPADKQEIFDFIKRATVDIQPKSVMGAVLPHAGYVFSGEVAVTTVARIKLTPTVILLGPNHTGMGKPHAIATEGAWQTPLGEVEIDNALARHLIGISRYLIDDPSAHHFEHSIEVQLPILQYFKPNIKFVPIAIAGSAPAAYTEIGQAIARSIRERGSPVVVIASSDMTHYEPHDIAREKDFKVIDSILELDEDEMLRIAREYNVSMCGLGPVACLIRAAKELGANKAELVDYRTSGNVTGDFASVVGYAGIIIRAEELHPVVALAKQAVDTFVKERRVIKAPADMIPEMKEKAGVFVSLHKGHELRGCIGTFSPARSNIAEEIIINAVHSATEDPRFSPVTAWELPDINYSVDILSKPEPVADESELDPKKHGVIVEAGRARGLLLPNLEGVDTAEKQIEISRAKAGISPDEPVKLYRFEVKRYKQA